MNKQIDHLDIIRHEVQQHCTEKELESEREEGLETNPTPNSLARVI